MELNYAINNQKNCLCYNSHVCHFFTYFLAHPLWYMLKKSDLLGRFVKWAFKLNEFNIDFLPITSIKDQVVDDFIFKLTHIQNYSPWLVEFDGSSYSTRSRIGIKIQSPYSKNCEHFFRLFFLGSNYIAEYEAAIHGLKMLRGMSPKNVNLCIDSQLVAWQETVEFTTK